MRQTKPGTGLSLGATLIRGKATVLHCFLFRPNPDHFAPTVNKPEPLLHAAIADVAFFKM
jgi:hypothetical protein